MDRGVGREGELNNKLKMFITRYGAGYDALAFVCLAAFNRGEQSFSNVAHEFSRLSVTATPKLASKMESYAQLLPRNLSKSRALGASDAKRFSIILKGKEIKRHEDVLFPIIS